MKKDKKIVEKSLVVGEKKNVAKMDVKKFNEAIKEKKAVREQEAAGKVVEKMPEFKEEKYEVTVGLKDLLNAGCHLGHKISKTHPKAKEFIYASKDGIEIIDLVKTMTALEKACNYIHNAVRSGKKVLMLGTKRQARGIIKQVAMQVGAAYVTDRWLGGTITNWEQIRKSIRKLADIKDGLEKNKFTDKTKKEIGDLKKETIRLEKIIGGLTSLDNIFDILFVVDAGFEKTAMKEAALRGIKTVVLLDTDSDPKLADMAIPANDDNVKSISLIVEEIGKAIKS